MPEPTSIWSKAVAVALTSRTCRDRKVQRSVDPALYQHRNLIERLFNKLKHFPRIATRYNTSARNFLSAVLLASTSLWMRLESTT
jgi:transposase